MRIQCTNCNRVYIVSAEQISPMGRKVQCTGCNYMWYEYINDIYVKKLTDDDSIATTHSNNEIVLYGKNNRRIALKNLVFASATFIVALVLCFKLASDIFPNEAQKVYKIVSTYKDTISYKLGYKRDETSYKKELITEKLDENDRFLHNVRRNIDNS
ncbi:zinc-ribbon domain-containing protein [Wolbachia endosymbiont of Pentidionis agamae]|uniref:zinc-ribbon domain-containing protein n=1 Tax=Wolbachia endosymbiont of Pentidionis agamae TaxID=3110435 RepID=UPI002FD36105